MVRSLWKFSYINTNLFKNLYKIKIKPVKFKKIFCRSSIITKSFLKKPTQLYKGNIFTKFLFTKYSVGRKIGEFNVTRKPFSFPLKKKKR